MKLSEEKAQHLENIRQELCQGTLSNKEAESMVLETIEKEANKEEADYAWIEACCQFLEENIPVTQDNWPDHQQSNWENIQAAVSNEKKFSRGAQDETKCMEKAYCSSCMSGRYRWWSIFFCKLVSRYTVGRRSSI